MEFDAGSVAAVFDPVDRRDAPGCAVGIVREGRLAYARGFGMANLEYGVPITPASVFHVASVSKQFTAFAVGLLAEDGRLAWEDPVSRYVPELPACATGVRLRHLALHTSGLRDQWNLLELGGWRDGDVKTNDDVLDLVRRQREMNFAPGTEHLYSNTGYTLLAVIVERVSGMSFREFCRERIFDPLGMASSHFQDDHRTVVQGRAYAYRPLPQGGYRLDIPDYDTVGATSLFTTVEDLARWAAYLRRPAFAQAVVAEMTRAGALDDGRPIEYGLGLRIARDGAHRTIGHAGLDNGYRAQFTWYPDADLGVIVLANGTDVAPGDLARQAVEVCLGGTTRTQPPKAGPAAVQRDAGLEGTYWNAERGLALTARADEGGVGLQVLDERWALEPVAPRLYRREEVDWQVRFEPPDGEAGRLTLREGNAPAWTFVRVEQAAPAADDLRALAGVYRCEELDVSFELRVMDGALVWLRRKFSPAPLRPLLKGVFSARGGVTVVAEYGDGDEEEIRGVRLFTPRVRGLWCVRLNDKASGGH